MTRYCLVCGLQPLFSTFTFLKTGLKYIFVSEKNTLRAKDRHNQQPVPMVYTDFSVNPEFWY